jgi:Tfp pilus assembly protein PilF
MKGHLVELERMSLAALNAGRLKEAANLFESIVKEYPSWEHGTALYSLACCYEDIGELKAAEERYREALQYQPQRACVILALAW